MNIPVWGLLVQTRLNACHVTQRMRGPPATKAELGWWIDRFCQSSTKLPDGREVLIAGGHEAAYDPDFHIHDDVVVSHPNANSDIVGYPREMEGDDTVRVGS